MSESTTATVETPTVKALKAKKPRKATKTTTTHAESNGKAKKRELRALGTRDDALAVARTTDGKLNSDQVRILRALKSAKKPLNRSDLKEGVGIGRDGMYSKAWLDSLRDLDTRKLIAIVVPADGERGFTHEIRALGIKALGAAEKSFAKKE